MLDDPYYEVDDYETDCRSCGDTTRNDRYCSDCMFEARKDYSGDAFSGDDGC